MAPLLNEKDILIYQRKIDKYRKDCGCALGGVFLVTATLLYTVYVITSRSYNLHAVLVGFGVVFASAVSGKLIGIGIARIKLIFLCKLIEKHAGH